MATDHRAGFGVVFERENPPPPRLTKCVTIQLTANKKSRMVSAWIPDDEHNSRTLRHVALRYTTFSRNDNAKTAFNDA